MPYKVGKKTKTKGYPILKFENGKWQVIAHSSTVAKAEASIRARHMGSRLMAARKKIIIASRMSVKYSFFVLILCFNTMCQERAYPLQDMSPHPALNTNTYAYAFQRAKLRKEHEQELHDQSNESRYRVTRLRSQMNGAHAKL